MPLYGGPLATITLALTFLLPLRSLNKVNNNVFCPSTSNSCYVAVLTGNGTDSYSSPFLFTTFQTFSSIMVDPTPEFTENDTFSSSITASTKQSSDEADSKFVSLASR